jgi:hypothetical protein
VWLVESAGPGVRIGRITTGSAAERGGLRSGDIILQVNGRGATSPDVAARMIRAIPVGQAAILTVWRDGEQQQAQITVEPMREPFEVGYRGDNNGSGGDLNARITRLEQQLATVTEELQRLRQQMSQLPSASSGSTPSDVVPGVATPGTPPAPPQSKNSVPQADAPASDQTTPRTNSSVPPASADTTDDLFGTAPSNETK